MIDTDKKIKLTVKWNSLQICTKPYSSIYMYTVIRYPYVQPYNNIHDYVICLHMYNRYSYTVHNFICVTCTRLYIEIYILGVHIQIYILGVHIQMYF